MPVTVNVEDLQMLKWYFSAFNILYTQWYSICPSATASCDQWAVKNEYITLYKLVHNMSVVTEELPDN